MTIGTNIPDTRGIRYPPGTCTCGSCGAIGVGPGGSRFDSLYAWICPQCTPVAINQIAAFYGDKRKP